VTASVVYSSEFLAIHSEVPGWIPIANKFSEKLVDVERGLLSLVRISEELLEWKSSGSGSRKPILTAVRICCSDHTTPSIRKSLH
jgi:hypothetical protein